MLASEVRQFKAQQFPSLPANGDAKEERGEDH